MNKRQKRFIEWLRELDLVSDELLDALLEKQAGTEQYIGTLVVQEALITPEERDEVLTLQKLMSSTQFLPDLEIPEVIFGLVPERFVQQNQALPFMQIRDCLLVATTQPENQALKNELEHLTGQKVYLAPFRLADIQETARKLYSSPEVTGIDWISDDWQELGPRLTFVGAGDALGSGARNQTCLHIYSEEATFLIDCGPTSLTAMKQMGLSLDELDGAMMTHAHGDHFAGLPFVLLEQYTKGRTRPFWVMGAPHLLEHIQAFNELCYPNLLNQMSYEVHYLAIENSPRSVPGTSIMVYPFAMDHQSSRLCLGYQVHLAEEKIIAYTGDTAWCENLELLARDTDVFVCECSFFEPHPNAEIKHLSYQEIVAHKERLKTQRLILTHMGNEMLSKTHQVEFEVAFDGCVIDL